MHSMEEASWSRMVEGDAAPRVAGGAYKYNSSICPWSYSCLDGDFSGRALGPLHVYVSTSGDRPTDRPARQSAMVMTLHSALATLLALSWHRSFVCSWLGARQRAYAAVFLCRSCETPVA